jgi:hypothetical protein
MANEVYITKANGLKERFDPTKLEASLMRAGASNDVIVRIVRHISEELKDGVTTNAIYDHAFFLLKKFERPVVSRSSLKRAVMELGPTGFPFENYVAEIFKARGYEAKTDQMAQGHCVNHEIDIVAWNENRFIMAEAKFHNDIGIKSDVKIALYIKARFDDLRQKTFNYGGKERRLDQFWLVTNTKFTEQAIRFGECAGIHLIGWNYPARGNLHDLIDDSGLHPLTCLSTISQHDKRILFEKNVVLCKSVREDPSILHSLGYKQDKIDSIIKESELLCEPRTIL